MILRLSPLLSAVVFACLATFASAQAPRLQETWETGYQKDDATGAHVLGYWRFDGDKPLADSSGKGHDLTLRGASTAMNKGKQGGALESFPGFPVEDKNHAAVTAAKPPGLSPKGAFTLELWLKPKPAMEPRLRPHLLDKKYVDHTDYQWTLSEADKAGKRRLAATLGFGAESKVFHSEPIELPVGEWHHLAFVYDGTAMWASAPSPLV
jgi:Concanavalin A-like lectin/glucanases superfamily